MLDALDRAEVNKAVKRGKLPTFRRPDHLVWKSDREILNHADSTLGTRHIQPENIVRDEDGTYYCVAQFTDAGGTAKSGFLRCTGDPRKDDWEEVGAVPGLSTAKTAPFIFRHGGNWYLLVNGTSAGSGLELWKSTTGILGTYSSVATILPVGASGAWDENRCSEGEFIQKPDGSYVILYMGFDAGNTHEQIGMATCPAGSSIETPGNWTKYSLNPIIANGTATGADDAQVVADPFTIEVDGTWWICYFAAAAQGVAYYVHTSMMAVTTTDWVTFRKHGIIWENPGIYPPDPNGRGLGPNWRGHFFRHESGDILWPYGSNTGPTGDHHVEARLGIINPDSFKSLPRDGRWVRLESNATDVRLTKTGSWSNYTTTGFQHGGHAHISNTAGDRFKLMFEGTAVRVFALADVNCGKFNVYLDGDLIAADQDSWSGSAISEPWGVFLVNLDGLETGYHTLEIEVTGTHNAGASGDYLKIDYFEFLPSQGAAKTPPPSVTGAEDWHEVGAAGEPAFENSWVNHTPGTWTTAAFRKKNGNVELKGTVKSGTIGQVIFTLPVGYRPPASLGKMQFVRKNGGTIGSIEVATDGTVKVFSGSNGDVHLTGIVIPL